MARTQLNALTNQDFSDRELLHILNDASDSDGWASTSDIADVLPIKARENGYKPTNIDHHHHAMRCVSSRFSWMRRFGWVERNDDRTKWRLTPIGSDLMRGKLTKGLENSLNKLAPGDRVLVMRNLAEAFHASGAEAATMLRREWQHGARRQA